MNGRVEGCPYSQSLFLFDVVHPAALCQMHALTLSGVLQAVDVEGIICTFSLLIVRKTENRFLLYSHPVISSWSKSQRHVPRPAPPQARTAIMAGPAYLPQDRTQPQLTHFVRPNLKRIPGRLIIAGPKFIVARLLAQVRLDDLPSIRGQSVQRFTRPTTALDHEPPVVLRRAEGRVVVALAAVDACGVVEEDLADVAHVREVVAVQVLDVFLHHVPLDARAAAVHAVGDAPVRGEL